jgi:type IV secretory pathway VirB10-like protein
MRLITRKRSKRELVARQATDLAKHGREAASGRRRSPVVLLLALGAIAVVMAAKRKRGRADTPPPAPAETGPLAGPVRARPEPPSPSPAAAPPPPPPPAGAPPPPPRPAAPAQPPPPPPAPPSPPAPEASAEHAPGDAGLARELQDEIGRSGEAPDGEIDVTVHDGIAELGGGTQSPDEFRAVFDAAGEVDGVRGVQEPAKPPVERRPESDRGDTAA